MNATILKSWLLRGEFEKLEHVVLEGRGARLLGEVSPDLRTRVFLKGLPNYLVWRIFFFLINKNLIFMKSSNFYISFFSFHRQKSLTCTMQFHVDL